LRLKLDESLGSQAIGLFRDAGHDVSTVSEQGLGGAPDADLLEVCCDEERTLVTLDLGFSNVLRFLPERFAGIAVLRVPNPVELDVLYRHVRVLLEGLRRRELTGRLWIVELDRIREYDRELDLTLRTSRVSPELPVVSQIRAYPI
jgi:predicted nuclease of predicted toxin-antitoxin system